MRGSFAAIQVHILIQKIGALYGGKAALYRMALSERTRLSAGSEGR
jgi:hypothetical protein